VDCHCITHNVYPTSECEIKTFRGKENKMFVKEDILENKIVINFNIGKEIIASTLSRLLYVT